MTARWMKVLVGGALTLALGGCWSLLHEPGHEAGEPVAAKWSTLWYGATVIGPDGDKYVVKYSDGTLGTVAAADIRPLLPRHEVTVGRHVIAKWQTASWYPGTVLAVDATGATIKWDDGSSPSHAAFGSIAAD